jgi:nucleoside 2-deoxyribosyltransferase
MRIYQAGPLFSRAEQTWNQELTRRIEGAGHLVTAPVDLLTPEQIHEAGDQAPKLIFETCLTAVDRAECVVACLDGPQVDDGTAFEIGYAYARGLPVIGIRTDLRRAGETDYSRVNSMIQGCLCRLVEDIEGALLAIKAIETDRSKC